MQMIQRSCRAEPIVQIFKTLLIIGSCGKIKVKQESSTYCAVRKGSCSRQKDDCAWWPGKVTILQGARNLCRYLEEKRYGGL